MSPDPPRLPLRILLVEDNEWDAKVALEAFAKAASLAIVERAGDGAAALARLRRPATPADPRPDIVLLDLNLPKVDGRQVLKEVKEDPELRHIPIIVLTTSRAHTDIAMAYGLHANSYVNKPFDPDDYPAFAKALEEFWHVWSTSPSQ